MLLIYKINLNKLKNHNKNVILNQISFLRVNCSNIGFGGVKNI